MARADIRPLYRIPTVGGVDVYGWRTANGEWEIRRSRTGQGKPLKWAVFKRGMMEPYLVKEWTSRYKHKILQGFETAGHAAEALEEVLSVPYVGRARTVKEFIALVAGSKLELMALELQPMDDGNIYLLRDGTVQAYLDTRDPPEEVEL